MKRGEKERNNISYACTKSQYLSAGTMFGKTRVNAALRYLDPVEEIGRRQHQTQLIPYSDPYDSLLRWGTHFSQTYISFTASQVILRFGTFFFFAPTLDFPYPCNTVLRLSTTIQKFTISSLSHFLKTNCFLCFKFFLCFVQNFQIKRLLQHNRLMLV